MNNNPMQILQQLMNNKNPMVQNALRMYKSNDVNGLRQMAENMCKERGLNINDVMKTFGMR